jgi:hypothetical protein
VHRNCGEPGRGVGSRRACEPPAPESTLLMLRGAGALMREAAISQGVGAAATALFKAMIGAGT